MSVSLRAIVTTVLLLLLPLVGALALHHVEIRSSSIVTTGPPDTSFGVELPNPVPADASPKLSTEAPTMPASPAAEHSDLVLAGACAALLGWGILSLALLRPLHRVYGSALESEPRPFSCTRSGIRITSKSLPTSRPSLTLLSISRT